MAETEITVQVFEEKDVVLKKLEDKGFKLSEHFFMRDYYFSKFGVDELKRMEYADIIKNSFLVRNVGDDVYILYKNKELDENNNVISENKTSIKIEDEYVAVDLFLNAGLNNWCSLVQEMYCFKKEDMEFAVQVIDDLGVFIEYEEDEIIAHLKPEEKINVLLEKVKSLGLKIGADYSVKKVYEKLMKV